MKRFLALFCLTLAFFISIFLFLNTPERVASKYIAALQQGDIHAAYNLTAKGAYHKEEYLEAYSPLSLGNTYAKSKLTGINIEAGALISKEQNGSFVYVLSSNIQNKKALSEALLEVFDTLSENMLENVPARSGFYQYTLIISRNKLWKWKIEKDSFLEYLAEMQGSARNITTDLRSFQNYDELGNL